MPEVKYGNLPFLEAIKFSREKGLKISPASWRDVWQQAQIRAFTVARVTAMDVLIDIRDEVDKAISGGKSLGEFKKELREKLEKKGWFAPKGDRAEIEMPDGTVRKRLTGWRLETIYRSNLQTAYSTGRHKQMMESVTRVYWQYMAIMDAVTRPDHGAQHGKVFHRDHPFWDQWYPPNGFGCRCYVKTLSLRQMEQRGFTEETHGVKEQPDEGWRYNPGKEGIDKWQPDLNKYPRELREQYSKEVNAIFD
ncbi:MAG: minor capsid protein [Deltaproteobacteria bacterium]|nr:minor capsid protein [Deltaproteobacteria bacterium]